MPANGYMNLGWPEGDPLPKPKPKAKGFSGNGAVDLGGDDEDLMLSPTPDAVDPSPKVVSEVSAFISGPDTRPMSEILHK
jgi:hypothetical protein